jgi:hypothetical protein
MNVTSPVCSRYEHHGLCWLHRCLLLKFGNVCFLVFLRWCDFYSSIELSKSVNVVVLLFTPTRIIVYSNEKSGVDNFKVYFSRAHPNHTVTVIG